MFLFYLHISKKEMYVTSIPPTAENVNFLKLLVEKYKFTKYIKDYNIEKC